MNETTYLMETFQKG